MRTSFVAAWLPLVTSMFVACTRANQNEPLKTLTKLSNVTATEVLEDIAEATTCGDCQNVMIVLQQVANEGDETFVEVATDWCIAFGEAAADVCTGFMALEGPILAATLRNLIIPTRTSTLFCNVLFGLCDVPPVSNFTVSFPKAKPRNTRPSPSGEQPIQVVHISDVHVDLSYEVGSSYNCTESICCRAYTPEYAPGVTDYPAGPYGNHNCDSPLSLEESLYAAIEHHAPDAAFTLFTGDIVEGAQWLTSAKEIVTDIDSCYSHMRGLNLVYGAVGNHEANPVNSFPPHGLRVLANQSNQYMYDTLAGNWLGWIGPEAATTAATRAGAYSILHPGSNLRIISFNTQFYMKENFWLYTSTMSWDPNEQLSWLISELQHAEDAHEKVYMIGHMPMGSGDSLYDYSAFSDQIVQRYDATIAALFFGHTHRDQWEIAYSDYNDQNFKTATKVSYIAPALTPTSGNPTFRVYSIDPVTFGVLDYTVYFANMSLPNYQTVGPTWEKYYSIKETYGPLLNPPYTSPTAELVPAFWHNVTEVFEENDSVFQDYYARKQRGYDPVLCTGSCKSEEICGLRSSQSQFACLPEDNPASVKRRSQMGVGHDRDDHRCPGSVALPVLRALATDFKSLQQVLLERWKA